MTGDGVGLEDDSGVTSLLTPPFGGDFDDARRRDCFLSEGSNSDEIVTMGIVDCNTLAASDIGFGGVL